MNLLLDTHAFLWAAFEPSKLRPRVRDILRANEHRVAVSSMTFWEIALKAGLGKITLEGCGPEDLPLAAEAMRYEILLPDASDMASFGRLPRAEHKDLFDRMIVWQAIRQGFTLITKDSGLGVYQKHGLKTLW